jgi:membrane protein DedA with SNARE-associated domain
VHDEQGDEQGFAGVLARFHRREPGPHTLKWIGFPLIAMVIAANVGDAFMPTLVESNPLALIALNARNRNLILVTNQLDAASYYVVGFFRLLLSDPLFYLLGWYYRDRAVTWIEDRAAGIGGFLRSAEQYFDKAAYPLVAIMPNNFICLFAGSAGMPIRVFVALNAIGTLARLYLIRIFGEAFSEPIDDVLEFIGEYRPYLLALTIGIVVISSIRQAATGTGEVGEILHMEDDLEDDLEGDSEPDS